MAERMKFVDPLNLIQIMLAEGKSVKRNDKKENYTDLNVPEVIRDKNRLLEWSKAVTCFCDECLRKETCVDYLRGIELYPDSKTRKLRWDRRECKWFSPK